MDRDNIFGKAIWPGRRERFDIDYFDLLQPKRRVLRQARYKSGLYRSEKCGRELQYESALELDFMMVLESSPLVRSYFEQPVKIPYRRGRKKLKYTPDFGVYLTNGEFMIVEIKELHAMLEDRVQVKMEGLVEFCAKRGFGLLLTDGRHTIDDLKKIPPNRKLESEILRRLNQDKESIRKAAFRSILAECHATYAELFPVILEHDLYYTAFPFKLKRGGYNPLFRQVFVKGATPWFSTAENDGPPSGTPQ